MTEVDTKFMDKVKKTTWGCWEWLGSLSHNGYGQLKRKGKHYRAHRYAYSMLVGRIPDELVVMHLCDNPKCVNPKHLRAGTRKENTEDCVKKGRLNTARGENHTRAKLSDKEVGEIRKQYNEGKTQTEIGRIYGVGQDTVSRIVNFNIRAK